MQSVTASRIIHLGHICWTLSKGVSNGVHTLKLEALFDSHEQTLHLSHLIVPK
jgi:hypothetical protein